MFSTSISPKLKQKRLFKGDS